MDFRKLEKMVAEYTGPKIGFVVSGGGVGVAELATVPGVSKLLYEIKIPYSLEATEDFISSARPNVKGKYSDNAVSEEAAFLLADAARASWGDDIGIVTCTAAITTSRWRRGENHAWMCFVSPKSQCEKCYPGGGLSTTHLELSKMTKEEYAVAGGYATWKRRDEDRQIAEFLVEKAFSTFRR